MTAPFSLEFERDGFIYWAEVDGAGDWCWYACGVGQFDDPDLIDYAQYSDALVAAGRDQGRSAAETLIRMGDAMGDMKRRRGINDQEAAAEMRQDEIDDNAYDDYRERGW